MRGPVRSKGYVPFQILRMVTVAMFVVVLGYLILQTAAQAQGCSSLPDSTQLPGLISSNYLGNGQAIPPAITLQTSPLGYSYRVVCASSSGVRNQYRFVSIVAYYTSSDIPGGPVYGQFEFECVNSAWSAVSTLLDNTLSNRRTLTVSNPAVNVSVTRTDCAYCLCPSLSPPRQSDAVYHCSPCSGCSQSLCYTTDTIPPSTGYYSQTCCNYYLQTGTCTTACPPFFFPDANRTCIPCPLSCQNGGTLRSDMCGCNCTAVSSGGNCSTCLCQNGGTCSGNTCNCPPGYSGQLCATCIRTCSAGFYLDSSTCSCGPSLVSSVVYIRMSTLTNIDNHQKDLDLSMFQDEVKMVANNSLHTIGIHGVFSFDALCTSVQRCANDITAGSYRVQCKIMIFPTLTPTDTAMFLQTIGSIAISSSAIILDGNPQSISAGGFCSCALNVNNRGGTYSWSEAVSGQNVSQMCQYGVAGQNVTRYCSGQEWTEDATICPTVVTKEFNTLSKAIQNQTINTENVINVTTQLLTLVSQATEVVDQSSPNLAVVTTVITQISNITSPNAPVSNDIIVNIVSVLSSIQTWPPIVVGKIGSIIVKSFETIASSLVQQQNFTSLVTTQNQTTFVAKKVSIANLTIDGTIYSFSPPAALNDNQLSGNITTLQSPPASTASVFLPPALFKLINKTDVGIFFSIYRTASFFPIFNTSNTTMIASLVLGATIIGRTDVSFGNLSVPVQLNFTIPFNNYSSYSCVSWDFNAAGGRSNWTTKGCNTLKDDTSLNQIRCQCSHLTNFAILVDISSRVDSKPPSTAVKRALETITYIGVSLSLLGLAVTIATLLLIKNQRQKDVSKYHIQLCCALFGMLLVFVTGIDRTEHFGGCVTVSVLIHYFTLAAVMWMGAEAILMFQKIVIVFSQITTRFIVILSLICWVVPLIPVTIPLAMDRNFLVKRNAPDGYCFISNATVFFTAFLGPILLILAFNAIIFVIVITAIIKHTITKSLDHKKTTGSIQLIMIIASVFVLFGLTWVFGALTIMEAAPTFQIVFTVLNSFQGFLIFIFFCLLKKEIRSSWAQILRKCGIIQKTSDILHSFGQSTKHSLFTHWSDSSKMDKSERSFNEEMKPIFTHASHGSFPSKVPHDENHHF